MWNTQTYITEALTQAHEALGEDLEKLEAAVRPDSRENLAELCARLGATLAHITEHFQFEEQNGYMDVVRKREPHLQREIGHLAEEHRQLTQSLNAVIRQAATTTTISEALREQVRAWVQHLRQHETRENEVVQDAFNLDISAED
jgi:hemerythrin